LIFSSIAMAIALQGAAPAESVPRLSREQAEQMPAPELAEHLLLGRLLTAEEIAEVESKDLPSRELMDAPLERLTLYTKAQPSNFLKPGLCFRSRYDAGFRMEPGSDDKTPVPVRDIEWHQELTIADQCDDLSRNLFILAIRENEDGYQLPAETIASAMSGFKQWQDKLKKGEVSANDIDWSVDPAIDLQILDIDVVAAHLPAHRIYKVDQSGGLIRLFIEQGPEMPNFDPDPKVYWVVGMSRYAPDGGPITLTWKAKD
jgi:hypothetical protein